MDTAEKITTAYEESENIYDDVLTQNKWWSKLYISLFWGVSDVEISKKLFAMIPDDFIGDILDVPCGTMNLTLGKFKRLSYANIIGFDYSEDMLRKARKRISDLGLLNVSTIQGDVGQLPFMNETFDMVLSMNGFHVFPEKEKAYEEISRILKPKGQFLGCFYVKGESRRSDFIVDKYLAKKGWFTPPFQSKRSVVATLKNYFSSVELKQENAMIWFNCVK